MILSNQKMNNQISDSKIGLISGAVLFNNKKQKRDWGCADTPLPLVISGAMVHDHRQVAQACHTIDKPPYQ